MVAGGFCAGAELIYGGGDREIPYCKVIVNRLRIQYPISLSGRLLFTLRANPLDFILPASISCLAEVGNFLYFPFDTVSQ